MIGTNTTRPVTQVRVAHALSNRGLPFTVVDGAHLEIPVDDEVCMSVDTTMPEEFLVVSGEMPGLVLPAEKMGAALDWAARLNEDTDFTAVTVHHDDTTGGIIARVRAVMPVCGGLNDPQLQAAVDLVSACVYRACDTYRTQLIHTDT